MPQIVTHDDVPAALAVPTTTTNMYNASDGDVGQSVLTRYNFYTSADGHSLAQNANVHTQSYNGMNLIMLVMILVVKKVISAFGTSRRGKPRGGTRKTTLNRTPTRTTPRSSPTPCYIPKWMVTCLLFGTLIRNVCGMMNTAGTGTTSNIISNATSVGTMLRYQGA